MYDPIVPGVIERVKALVLQVNPMVGRDLNEVVGRLHTEYQPRTAQRFTEIAAGLGTGSAIQSRIDS